MMDEKTYLGDSVYAKNDGWRIILTTEGDVPEYPFNIIYLEPVIMDALIKFYKDNFGD